MATYVVGDIQGCLSELLKLLDKVEFSYADRLWLAGDLVNRGPKSLETLRFVRSLGSRAKTVLGNHDLHLLATAWDGTRKNRKDTLNPILKAPDRDELLDWLRRQPLVHHDSQHNWLMVHAGIPPIWDAATAARLAAEVEHMLRSDQAGDYLAHMYGNKPARWSEDHRGWNRLRCITNYLTRMRFCAADGTLELKTKGSPQDPPAGYRPWYSHPRPRWAGTRILFGHWAALEGQTDVETIFALDTGCVWGGHLTALRLEDGKHFRCPSPGYG